MYKVAKSQYSEKTYLCAYSRPVYLNAIAALEFISEYLLLIRYVGTSMMKSSCTPSDLPRKYSSYYCLSALTTKVYFSLLAHLCAS